MSGCVKCGLYSLTAVSIRHLDQWPQVEVKQMIGTEKIPERIGMSFAGGQQPIQLTLKK